VQVGQLDRLSEIAEWIASYPGYRFLVVIAQNRRSVCEPKFWQESVRQIFCALPTVNEFQIGQATNRSKWGCLHFGEYAELAERIDELRGEFPHVRLAGPSLIDFEPLAMIRSLLNWRRFRFDAVASALYVDRRGAPTSTQYQFFDLPRKIRLQAAINSLSPRLTREGRGRMWITETNWPLLDTGESAPTSKHECVSEEEYADYLRAYFQLAHQTGLVERVYWWQLVAAGYGLVDPREKVWRKRPGFFAMKRLLSGEVSLTRQSRID